MFRSAVTLFAFRGIDIRVARSWLIIAALVAWSLWSRLRVFYDHSTAWATALAVVGTVLFFTSILVHEMAHALEGRHRGAEVHGITLFLFGGVTESNMAFERPRDEFSMAAVGPYASFVTAGLLGLVVVGIHQWLPAASPVADILGILGWINVALGLFNLLPAAPLDGGRVLRSLIWKITGDRHRAIRGAGRAGQVFGFLLAGFGLLVFLTFAGGSLGGLWLVFIGWFLANAAGQEVMMSRVQETLQGHRVGDLVLPPEPRLPVGAPADDAARTLTRVEADVLPAEDGERVVGVVRLEDVSSLSRQRRQAATVRDVMIPSDDLPTLPSDASAADLIEEVSPGRPVLVTTDGTLSGVMTVRRLSTITSRLQLMGDTGQGRLADRRERWLPRRKARR